MEIVPGIHMLAGTVGGRPLQLYLLRGDERTVLLDTGCASDPDALIFPYLARLGLGPDDLDLVINTHADLDHTGGNAAVKRANPRVLLTCGEADRELIEDPQVMWAQRYNRYAARHELAYDDATRDWIVSALGDAQPVDFTWTGGETLRLGRDWLLEVHHAPGHSAGHLVLFDRARRILLSGDAAHGSVYRDLDGRPALCPTYVNVDAYLATLRYLRGLDAAMLCGCHWPLMSDGEVTAFLDESEQFVKLADQVVRAELARRPEGMTLAELLTSAGPHLGDWPRPVDQELVYALSGHLDQLVALEVAHVATNQTPARYW